MECVLYEFVVVEFLVKMICEWVFVDEKNVVVIVDVAARLISSGATLSVYIM